MRRTSLRAWGMAMALLSVVVVSTVTRQALADGPQPGAIWGQFKGDGQRTGQSRFSGPFTPTSKWVYSTDSPVVRGPVIAADGTIVIGLENGQVRAYTTAGAEKWKYSGDGIATVPAINSKGIVVVGFRGGLVLGLKLSDGSEEWRFNTATAPYGDAAQAVRGHPMLASNFGALLIGTDAGNVYELDEAGQYRGIRRSDSPVRAGAAVTPDGTLVWASHDKNIYGGNTFGGDKWKHGIDAETDSTPAAAPDSTIYIGTSAGSVYALRSTDGSEKWRVKPSGSAIRSSPSIGPDGTVYIGSDDQKLYALDPTNGSTKWSYTTGGAVTSSVTIGANGLLYVGSNDSNLYVLHPDGKLQSTFKADSGIDFSSPAIGSDGTLYIGSRDNKLYALSEGGPTPTPTSAATATAAASPPAAFTPTPVPPPTQRVEALPDALYFFETGHNVRGPFLTFFNANGGLAIFGFPRTEQYTENGRTIQYFQRARMEYFPENAGTPAEVQLGLIGDELLRSKGWIP